MGLENFKDGVEQPRTIETETVAISVPVSVVFTDGIVNDSGEIEEKLDQYYDDISDALLYRTDAESFDIHIEDAKEIPLEDATWD